MEPAWLEAARRYNSFDASVRADYWSKLTHEQRTLLTSALAAISSVTPSVNSGRIGASSRSPATRLLCASAFLSGVMFRKQILTYLNDKGRGAAPELGLDLSLVARVCKFANRRERRIQITLVLASTISLLACLIDPTFAFIVFVISTGIVYFQKTYAERSTLVEPFRRERFDQCDLATLYCAELDQAVMSCIPNDDQNLITYCGFDPFIGAGSDRGGWSFSVDLTKPCNDLHHTRTPTPFTAPEIYDAIGAKLSRSQLDELVIRDYFFVSGRQLRTDRKILPDIYGRPRQHIDADDARRHIVDNDERIRHYKCIRIHEKDGETINSFYFRCSIRGNSLFVEIRRFLLSPLRGSYRLVDTAAPPGGQATLLMFLSSFLAGPFYAVAAPFLLLADLSEAFDKALGGKERLRRRKIDENLEFDYGAGQGLRQSFGSGNFAHYFQLMDCNFYSKTLDASILDGAITFLEEHNIDTSELRDRQTMILNSGIIVHGGDVKAESLAVGKRARSFNRVARHIKAKAGAG